MGLINMLHQQAARQQELDDERQGLRMAWEMIQPELSKNGIMLPNGADVGGMSNSALKSIIGVGTGQLARALAKQKEEQDAMVRKAQMDQINSARRRSLSQAIAEQAQAEQVSNYFSGRTNAPTAGAPRFGEPGGSDLGPGSMRFPTPDNPYQEPAPGRPQVDPAMFGGDPAMARTMADALQQQNGAFTKDEMGVPRAVPGMPGQSFVPTTQRSGQLVGGADKNNLPPRPTAPAAKGMKWTWGGKNIGYHEVADEASKVKVNFDPNNPFATIELSIDEAEKRGYLKRSGNQAAPAPKGLTPEQQAVLDDLKAGKLSAAAAKVRLRELGLE